MRPLTPQHDPHGIDWSPKFVGTLFWQWRRERLQRKFRELFPWWPA